MVIPPILVHIFPYLMAAPVGVGVDWLMYQAIMMRMYGSQARDFKYREFFGIRTVLIVVSACMIASTFGREFTILSLAGLALFLLSHFYIYFSIFYEAWKDRR